MQPVPPSEARSSSGTPLLAARLNVGSEASETRRTGAATSSEGVRNAAAKKKSLLQESSESEGEHSSGSSRQQRGPAVRPFRASERSRSSGSEREHSLRNTSDAAGSKQHFEARKFSAHPTMSDSSASSVLPDVKEISGSSDPGNASTLVDMLKTENDALKRKIASFEQQHRFMMSALDREYHLKVKEQERQRTVLRAELEEVLKQLKYGQLECKDKVEAAEAQVEEERRKTAAAEKLLKQAQQQRNQLVTQVAAMRAELSRRDSQCCFEDLSDLLGHGPEQKGGVGQEAGGPRGAAAEARDSNSVSGGQQGADHNIKPFVPLAQKPPAARAAAEHDTSSQGLASDAAGAGSTGTSGLTRDQLGALRRHVKALATEKLSLLQQVASLREKWEDAHERAGAAERLAAQLTVVRSEREAALALSSNILAGAFNSCPACSRSSQARDATRPNAGAHKRPPGAAGKIPTPAASNQVALSEAEELRLLREEAAGLQREVSMLRQGARHGQDERSARNPEHNVEGASCAAEAAGQGAEADALRNQLSEALAVLEDVRTQLASAVSEKTELKHQLDALGSTTSAAGAQAARCGGQPGVDAGVPEVSGLHVEREAKILELEEALFAQQEELAQTKAVVDSLSEEARHRKDDASRANDESARLQHQVQHQVQELAHRADENGQLRQEVAYLVAERDELKAASEGLLLQLSSLGREHRPELEQEMQEAKSAVLERDGEITKLREELAESTRSVHEVREELLRLQQHDSRVGNGLKDELVDMERKAAEETIRAHALQEEVADLKRRAVQEGDVAKECQQELEILQDKIQDMKKELASIRDEAEGAGREVAVERRELEEEGRRIQAAGERLRLITRELEEERRDGTGLRTDLEEERGKVAALTQQLQELQVAKGAAPRDEALSGKTDGRPWSGRSSGRPSSGMLSSAQTPQLGQRSASGAGSTSPSVQLHAQELSVPRNARPSSASNPRPTNSEMSRPPAARARPARPASAHIAGQMRSSSGTSDPAPNRGGLHLAPSQGALQGQYAEQLPHAVSGSLTAAVDDESDSDESGSSREIMRGSDSLEREGLTPPPRAASAATKSDSESDATRPGTPPLPPEAHESRLASGPMSLIDQTRRDEASSQMQVAQGDDASRTGLPERIVPKLGLGPALARPGEQLEERRQGIRSTPRIERPSAPPNGRSEREALEQGSAGPAPEASTRPSLALRSQEREQVSPMVQTHGVSGSLTAAVDDESDSDESGSSREIMRGSDSLEREGLTPPPRAASAATKSDSESDATRPGTPPLPPEAHESRLASGPMSLIDQTRRDEASSQMQVAQGDDASRTGPPERIVPKLGLGPALARPGEQLEERRQGIRSTPRIERPSAPPNGRSEREALEQGSAGPAPEASTRPSLALRSPSAPKERKQVSPMVSTSSAGLAVKSPSPGSEGLVSDMSQSQSEEDPVYQEDEDFVQDDNGHDVGVEDSFENAVDEAITHSRGGAGWMPTSREEGGGSARGGAGPI